MKIALGAFNAKVGREYIFNPSIGNESLHQDNNNSGVRIANLPHHKMWLLRTRCFLTVTFISTPGPLLIGRLTTRLVTY